MLNNNKSSSAVGGCGCGEKKEDEKWRLSDVISSPSQSRQQQQQQVFGRRKLDFERNENGSNGLPITKRSNDDSAIMTTTAATIDDNWLRSSSISRRRHSAAVTTASTMKSARQMSANNVTATAATAAAAAVVNSRAYSEVISDGKSLCGQFIRGKLKRSGLFHKKFGLQRIRSIIFKLNDQSDSTYNTLQHVAIELEKMYPHIYSDVLNQTMKLSRPIAATTATGDYTSSAATTTITASATATGLCEKQIQELFKAIVLNIFRSEITWSKVVAVYCVAGALAVDCVRESRPELINDILEAFTELLEIELAEWIVLNGGWISLVLHYRKKNDKLVYYRKVYMASAATIALIAIVYFYSPIVIMHAYEHVLT